MNDINSFEIIDGSIIDSLVKFFDIVTPDSFIYSTDSSSVTLAQTASLLSSRSHKFHYFSHGKPIEIPTNDIDAYTNIFKSSTDTTKALSAFVNNAKKTSPRELVARHLQANRYFHPSFPPLSKSKTHINPYLDLWTLACHQLGFLGPLGDTGYSDPTRSKQSHPLLPIFMHHFGCAIPTYEALQIINLICTPASFNKKKLIDLGSGNGYWSFLLTRMNVPVVSVDDVSSSWRTSWPIPTVKADAIQWLRETETADMVMMLVYPVTANQFTERAIQGFMGSTIVVVGTLNGNGYTGFAKVTVEEWMKERGGWEVMVKIAVPSFPGKDDGLIVFQRVGVTPIWKK